MLIVPFTVALSATTLQQQLRLLFQRVRARPA
jgi:hypothetical protein